MYLAQLLGAVLFIHFISNHDTLISIHDKKKDRKIEKERQEEKRKTEREKKEKKERKRKKDF